MTKPAHVWSSIDFGWSLNIKSAKTIPVFTEKYQIPDCGPMSPFEALGVPRENEQASAHLGPEKLSYVIQILECVPAIPMIYRCHWPMVPLMPQGPIGQIYKTTYISDPTALIWFSNIDNQLNGRHDISPTRFGHLDHCEAHPGPFRIQLITKTVHICGPRALVHMALV